MSSTLQAVAGRGTRVWSPEERIAREELAAAHRIAALEGLDDGIWNHFSLVMPDQPDRFLLKPHGLLFSEVRASDLMVVDHEGRRLEGSGPWNPTAFYIHSRVHLAFPEAACVFHTHMPYATALSCARENRIVPVTQNSMRFEGRVGYYDDYGGLAFDAQEADRMVEAMRGHDVLMMANHGVMVTGRTVAEAVYTLHYVEMACREQVFALQAGGAAGIRTAGPDIAALTFSQIDRNRLEDSAVHFRAMIRVLDRQAADFRE